MDPEKTFQVDHIYEIDGDPDELWTVIARGEDPSYIMLHRLERLGRYETAIYPMAVVGGEENLLLPCPLLNDEDYDEDGTPLPYWVPMGDCLDVTLRESFRETAR